jgi:hypothetical protein
VPTSVHHLDGDRALVRDHADDNPRGYLTHVASSCSTDECRAAGHRYFEQSNPFLSLSRPVGARGRAGHVRATRDPWAAALRATTSDTSTEPRQTPVVTSMEQVAALRGARRCL